MTTDKEKLELAISELQSRQNVIDYLMGLENERGWSAELRGARKALQWAAELAEYWDWRKSGDATNTEIAVSLLSVLKSDNDLWNLLRQCDN